LCVLWMPKDLKSQLFADFGLQPHLGGLFSRKLIFWILDFFHNSHVLEEINGAGLFVESRLHLARLPKSRLSSLADCRLHRFDQNFPIQSLLASDVIDHLQKITFCHLYCSVCWCGFLTRCALDVRDVVMSASSGSN